MSSDKGKKFSLDKLTDMHTPNEEKLPNEVPMVVLTEKDWNALTSTLNRMQALTNELEAENRKHFSKTETAMMLMERSVSSVRTEIKEQLKTAQQDTDKAFRQTQTEYARQVGKLNAEYTSLVQRTEKREKAMFWTSLICSLFPLAFLLFWLALRG